jgi:hypothetical protein
LNTLDKKFRNKFSIELNVAVNENTVARIFNNLEELPNQISYRGSELDSLNIDILEIQRQINKAENNLKFAEATVIAFPERDLKNEAQRKAYIVEKTQEQQKVVIELQNKKLSLESAKLDIQNEVNRLHDSFSASKYKASLISSILDFMGE